MNLINILEEMKEVCERTSFEDCEYCSFQLPCGVISSIDLYGPCDLSIDEIKEDLGIIKPNKIQQANKIIRECRESLKDLSCTGCRYYDDLSECVFDTPPYKWEDDK